MELMRVLIVDDEPLARRRIRSLLERDGRVEIVGECGDGLSAVHELRRGATDLVFLDIQMPDLDGFGVVDKLGPGQMPTVVFVTAFDEHALEAFSVSALDYLLKPFEDERFETALERALLQTKQRNSNDMVERLERLIDSLNPSASTSKSATTEATLTDTTNAEPQAPKRLALNKRGRVFFVPVCDIDWIEAAGSYVRLHTGSHSHLLRGTIKRMEAELAGEFVRIHRSTLVRIDRIEMMAPLFHGEYQVQLTTGVKLKLSRSYRSALKQLF